jgi:hypothetical protein
LKSENSSIKLKKKIKNKKLMLRSIKKEPNIQLINFNKLNKKKCNSFNMEIKRQN